MLHDIIRLSTQHRALHCYVLLSLWIFLLVAGVYKFLEPVQKAKVFDLPRTESMQNYRTGLKTKRIFKSCNRLEQLYPGAEGSVDIPHWNLKGVIVVIRHGDRGPLQHIRNISTVNCGSPPNQLLTSYQNHIHNMSSSSGRAFWMQMGPFHGFPILPLSATQCTLGQLTMQGVSQLLRTGQILHRAYTQSLKLNNVTASDVVVFCTRYRRTFQSVLALLFPLVPLDYFNRAVVRESHSMNFCFSDCACASSDHFMRLLKEQVSEQLRFHPAVVRLIQQAASLVFAQPNDASNSNPLALRDALLTYICHNSVLPCSGSLSCLRADHVSALFAYTEWENHQRLKNKHWRNACLLKAYGLFKNIVSYMLKMASESSPKVVIYSGHDYTLQYLSVALGISSEHIALQYASRLVIEVYQNEDIPNSGPKGFYFKLLVNGKDVTKEIPFCRNYETAFHEGKITVFCKMEDIVRFIHDDYFSCLNVTNFKDACYLHKNKNEERKIMSIEEYLRGKNKMKNGTLKKTYSKRVKRNPLKNYLKPLITKTERKVF